MKHTQGEWEVVFPTKAPNGVLVIANEKCLFFDNNNEEGVANAKLIAASPDLLEALNTAKHTLTQLNTNGLVDNTIFLINKAIKKATE